MLDLIEQFFDTHALFHVRVIIERQFGNASEMMQPFAQRMARVTCRGSQSFQRLLPLIFITKYRDEDASVPEIGRYFHVRDRREANTWILYLPLDDLAQLDPKLLFDAINPSALHSFNVGPTVRIVSVHRLAYGCALSGLRFAR